MRRRFQVKPLKGPATPKASFVVRVGSATAVFQVTVLSVSFVLQEATIIKNRIGKTRFCSIRAEEGMDLLQEIRVEMQVPDIFAELFPLYFIHIPDR